MKFFKKWNEFLTIPLALLLWWASIPALRWLDPTSAVYDAGVFQTIIFAIIAVLTFNGFAWLLLKINFPIIYKHLDDNLDKDFKILPRWQQALYALCIFALYLLSLVLVIQIL